MGDVLPRAVAVPPELHGFAILGKCLQLPEPRALPVVIAHDDGHHYGFSLLVPFDGARHFLLVAVVRRDEVCTGQQQNEIGGFEALVDTVGPFLAAEDAAVVPRGDETLALEELEVSIEFVAERFVLVGIAVNSRKACIGMPNISALCATPPSPLR